MNLGKSREYFSSYYEGSLDRGLREGFERALREDAQVQAEYRAFERTMRQLESMKGVEAPLPDDLHERIVARIDRHIWESQQKRKPAGLAWWKLGLAVTAIAGVVVLTSQLADNGSRTVPAGLTPTLKNAQLDIQATDLGVELTYPSVGSREIIIRDADGTVLDDLHLRNQGIRGKVLANVGIPARLLTIEERGGPTTWVALPGSDRLQKSIGKGELKVLATEIAATCNVPVVLQVKNPTHTTVWKLDPIDPDRTARSAVEPLGLRVELRDRGHAATLWILDK